MRLGSHNTMTYLRPSQWWLRPFAWIGRCQSESIGVQFITWGVRWFDFRLAFDKKDGKPYFAHGIFSYKDKNVFAILDYLNTLASPDDKAYVRLLNERDSEFNKKCFKHFCDSIDNYPSTNGKYRNLIFCGGQNKKDWKMIYRWGNTPDKPLIDKYSSCNHDKCDYDENGNEVNHINNTGVVIDDICPEWYAKRNNLKNRTKYIDQDVYLLLDFIGKY